MSDFLDRFLDREDERFDLLREDGWTCADIRDRNYLDADGRYAGPKHDPREPVQ